MESIEKYRTALKEANAASVDLAKKLACLEDNHFVDEDIVHGFTSLAVRMMTLTLPLMAAVGGMSQMAHRAGMSAKRIEQIYDIAMSEVQMMCECNSCRTTREQAIEQVKGMCK